MPTARPRRSVSILGSTLFVAVVQIMSLPLMTPSARAHGLAPASEGFDDLMVEAEDKRAAGAYAESAALYARAYRARPEAERADQVGEITVRNAITDYDLALVDTPDLALLQAQAELLDEFLRAREQTKATKKSKKAPGVPQDLVDELARIEARIAELREEERLAAQAAQADPLEPVAGPEPAPAKPERKPTPKRDAAILGVGVATFVGGAALIGGSAWNFAKITDRGNARVAALDAEARYTPAQRSAYEGEIDEWRDRWRGISTGMIVGGVALAAAGIGLSSWAIVRMRRQRSSPSGAHAQLAPALGRAHIGGVLTIAF